MRNSHGFASHGKDPSFQQLEAVQAFLVARSADAIVNFLYRVHKDYSTDVRARRLAYGDHPDFDSYVDDINEVVRIFQMEYRPSEVLFAVDPQAYRSYLADWEAQEADESGAVAAEEDTRLEDAE